MKIATLLFAATAVFAQSPVMTSVMPLYETAKLNFVEAGEFMPAGDYSFRLSPAQRPWGEWLEHTAGMNVRMCGQMKGESAPAPNTGDKSKEALLRAVNESFAYCDGVLKSMTDEAALKTVDAGGRKVVPLAVMISHIANLNEHYGNMVGYLRAKNIVPPTTARVQKQQQKK